jgi:hypothetical protein
LLLQSVAATDVVLLLAAFWPSQIIISSQLLIHQNPSVPKIGIDSY